MSETAIIAMPAITELALLPRWQSFTVASPAPRHGERRFTLQKLTESLFTHRRSR